MKNAKSKNSFFPQFSIYNYLLIYIVVNCGQKNIELMLSDVFFEIIERIRLHDTLQLYLMNASKTRQDDRLYNDDRIQSRILASFRFECIHFYPEN